MFSCSLQLFDKNNKTKKTTSAAKVQYLEKNSLNRVYLVTYSQLDIRKIPTGQSFCAARALAFGSNKVLYGAVGRKKHASSGAHYHVSIHLENPQKWLPANFKKSPLGEIYAGAFRS